jgi:membrane protein implicated in regulation of membrane protease activity
MLITGMVWIFLHYSTESGRTVLKLGNLRFTQAVFCIPLLIGILLLMSGRTGRICKAGVIFTAAGALAAGIAVMIGTVSSDPWYICLIFTVLFLGGMVLFVRNTVKIYKIKQKQKQQEKASAATDLTAKM